MKKIQSYRSTTVHWGKSQANIVKLLMQYGIQDTRFTFLSSQNQLICEFNYPIKIMDTERNLGVRILVPVPTGKDEEKEKNQVHRALYFYLKSKFEALSFNLVEFVQEFMPHLVVFDKKGGSQTMFQAIAPQYMKSIEKGEQGEIKLLTNQ